MPFDEKKKLYGPARLAVGGPTEGADDAKPRVRNNDDVEPVAYHAKKLVVTATAQASKRKVTPGATPLVPNPSLPKKRRTRKPKTPDEKKSDLLQRLKKLGVNNDDGDDDPEDADDAEDLDADEEAVDSGVE